MDIPIFKQGEVLIVTFQPGIHDASLVRLRTALVEEVVKQVGEDVPIWNHKAHRPSPSLAPGDGPIMKFRRWAEQFSAG